MISPRATFTRIAPGFMAAKATVSSLPSGPLRGGQHHLKALLAALAHELVPGHRLPPSCLIVFLEPTEERLVLRRLRTLSLSGDNFSYPGQKQHQGLHDLSHCRTSFA